MKNFFVLCLLVFVASCVSSLPEPDDKKVLSKSIKQVDRFSLHVDINAQDFASWDIPVTSAYAYSEKSGEENSSYLYESPRHDNLFAYKGVRVLTSRSMESKVVAGELAASMEYWLGREVRRLFMTRMYQKFGSDSIYNPNPKKLKPEDKDWVFYFKTDPVDDKFFKMNLFFSGISKENIRAIVKECSSVDGWHSLGFKKGMTGRLGWPGGVHYPDPLRVSQERNRENRFHYQCFSIIKKYNKGALPARFANNYYYDKSKIFAPRSIKQVIRYSDDSYDAGFIEHVKGRYGQHIKKMLNQTMAQRDIKEKVVVTLDSRVQGLLSWSHVKDDYFFRMHWRDRWTSHVMDGLFGLKDTLKYYNDYEIKKNYLLGKGQYSGNFTLRNVIQPLDSSCRVDGDFIQIAYKYMSRFELNCWHKPIKIGNREIDDVNYRLYREEFNFNKKSQNNNFQSHVKVYSLDEYNLIKKKSGVDAINTAVFEYTFNQPLSSMDSVYQSAVNEGILADRITDPNQPDDSLLTHFALTLAKQYPPNAVVSWINNDKEAYVLNHGILWVFPLDKIRNTKNELTHQL